MNDIVEHLNKVSSSTAENDEKLEKLRADHRAICEVAGFQPTSGGFIFYLEAKEKDGNFLNLTLYKEPVIADNAIYDKDEVLTALSSMMSDAFPTWEYPSFSGKQKEWTWGLKPKCIELFGRSMLIKLPYVRKRDTEALYHVFNEARVSNKVAQQTRRGAAKNKFLDFLYYKGSSDTDSPFIVYKFGDKYGIFKHPKAELYGYRLIQK